MNFVSSLKYKIVYVFRINDEAHTDCLKIGETTCPDGVSPGLLPNSKELNEVAKKRIRQYTQTAGISFDLLHTELTIYIRNKQICSFNDKEIHSILERSGVKRKQFNLEFNADEWFLTDLETVKKAISAAKEGRSSLLASEVTKKHNPIVFRPEQRSAIDKTKKQFKKSNQMLWNAKMRFGKTLSALQLVRELSFKRTLILTHRPVVNAGWFEDFKKIFYDTKDYLYGSRDKGDNFTYLENFVSARNGHYVYFASMQDLRGSELVGGNFYKNNLIFATNWDFLIIDEAHEGTQTELGKAVTQELIKPTTKVLRLSGTPFNLFDEFKDDEIYTWDYVMEQRAKMEWDTVHLGDHNPYADLPTLKILTYSLGELLKEYRDEDVAFNFKEFFRTNEDCSFKHQKDVVAFLNLLVNKESNSSYPFSSEEYRDTFRHSLWIVPGVKEAKALSVLLKKHPVFQLFQIVNVAGEGDEDEESLSALEAVNSAIGENSDETRTITLSCGRLTTGVSVKAWTAVFMLAGSYNTSASSYMQTIFRVQTPAMINGRVKTECYVFDFAPDRTLKVLAETAKISAKAGKTTKSDEKIMGEFLNFCPVISVQGSEMKPFDVPRMLEQLKQVYIDRAVRNGFEDNCLYNDELLKLDNLELQAFDDLQKIVGKTKTLYKPKEIDINSQGLTEEEYAEREELEGKKRKKGKEKRELTPEELARLDELNEKKKNRDSAISILRSISIRMPLLIYGAEIDDKQEISLDNFASLVDDKSWEEFMPRGVTKEHFESFKKYYDADIFRGAGKRIRVIAKAADKLPIEERIERITDLFSTFRNPDKETVLTPWKVVNMHLGDCLGGYNFYDETFSTRLSAPRLIERGEVTKQTISNIKAKVLELNSKTGLYSLYVAYSFYRAAKNELLKKGVQPRDEEVWKDVLANNIFIVCNTAMGRNITKRTLTGYEEVRVNIRCFDDLIMQITGKSVQFISKISRPSTYGNKTLLNNMKFDAIVGNPPYQVMDSGNNASAKPVYNAFVDISKMIAPNYISLIMPSRWFAGGKGLDEFRASMLRDKRIVYMKDYPNSKDCFPESIIGGGVCYFLWNRDYQGNCVLETVYNGETSSQERDLSEYPVLIRFGVALNIIKKVNSISSVNLSSMVSSRNPFSLPTSIKGTKHTENSESSYKVYTSKGISYIDASKVQGDEVLRNSYKVMLGRAISGHAGETDVNGQVKVLSTVRTIAPKEVCSDTYIVAGRFESHREANNLAKYLKSRFARFLVLQTVTSINITRSNYSFVPQQNFSEHSDIDWDSSAEELDKQLYKKYNLSMDEVAYIEKLIRQM